MKVVLPLLLCIFIQHTPAQAQQEATLCMDNYPPFTYFIEGKPTGAMVDALEIIAEKMQFTLNYTPNTPFIRCMRMAEAGLVDFVVSLLRTPERMNYLAMFPYSSPEPSRFIVQTKMLGSLKEEKDILPLRVGLIKGFLYPKFFRNSDLLIETSSTPEAGIRKLRANQIDALALNETVALHILQSEKNKHDTSKEPIALLDFFVPWDEDSNVIGLSKKSKLISREEEISAYIEAMRIDGTFIKLIDHHKKHQ
ncbi:transporter substrate-binding domain-containing protein [Simiduia curdlanivorans]|uniref:Substrate-binding periplasmic protein n=1 Tax=Simiduia curdlanivorans TaxID=1492769 RepID=A0ABV8V906_9GAMM|nr:transporter substrate-binding domain-containing protein [Simiduia curdlanivorans]MDN3638886.1 transporter substrate-binding domain-containing protein [Simiduia curdlanivorans]